MRYLIIKAKRKEHKHIQCQRAFAVAHCFGPLVTSRNWMVVTDDVKSSASKETIKLLADNGLSFTRTNSATLGWGFMLGGRNSSLKTSHLGHFHDLKAFNENFARPGCFKSPSQMLLGVNDQALRDPNIPQKQQLEILIQQGQKWVNLQRSVCVTYLKMMRYLLTNDIELLSPQDRQILPLVITYLLTRESLITAGTINAAVHSLQPAEIELTSYLLQHPIVQRGLQSLLNNDKDLSRFEQAFVAWLVMSNLVFSPAMGAKSLFSTSIGNKCIAISSGQMFPQCLQPKPTSLVEIAERYLQNKAPPTPGPIAPKQPSHAVEQNDDLSSSGHAESQQSYDMAMVKHSNHSEHKNDPRYGSAQPVPDNNTDIIDPISTPPVNMSHQGPGRLLDNRASFKQVLNAAAAAARAEQEALQRGRKKGGRKSKERKMQNARKLAKERREREKMDEMAELRRQNAELKRKEAEREAEKRKKEEEAAKRLAKKRSVAGSQMKSSIQSSILSAASSAMTSTMASTAQSSLGSSMVSTATSRIF